MVSEISLETMLKQFEALASFWPEERRIQRLRREAWNVYRKMAPSERLHKAMIDAAELQSQSRQWETLQYVPMMHNWLSQQRWTDPESMYPISHLARCRGCGSLLRQCICFYAPKKEAV